MARKRSLQPGYVESAAIEKLSFTARYLDQNLWCHLDGNGMIEESPSLIKSKVFPRDDMASSQVTVLLQELIRGGRLFSLEVDGKRWLYRKDFRKEQRIYSDEQRKTLVNREILDSFDKSNVIPPPHVLDGDCQPQLFSTSTSSSTSSSASPSNFNFSNGDKSGTLPPFNPPKKDYWNELLARLKGKSEKASA